MSPRYIFCVLGSLFLTASSGWAADEPEEWGTMVVRGNSIAPGEKARFPMIADRGYEAAYLNLPIFIARGSTPGPTLCVTAGIHGDETNSVEVARSVFAQTDPGALKGTLFMMPMVNADGFRSMNRYMTDRRDLNRSFPGNPNGSVASLVAHAVFTELEQHCTALVDLHTGSNLRANFPQIRVDLDHEASRKLAEHFGVGVILGGGGPDGSLRGEMVKAGIPAIIYEAGGPFVFQQEETDRGVAGVKNAMHYLGMIELADYEPPQNKIYHKTTWTRVPRGQGGFFFPELAMGAEVKPGTRMGKVVDPVTDKEHVLVSEHTGQVIGMAWSQPVLSGSPLFHLGLE